MAPPEHRRPLKRAAISDQQRRRELSLLRQAQNRQDAQQRARFLASSVLTLGAPEPEPDSEPELEPNIIRENEPKEFNVRDAAKLRGAEARKWFARQLMLPEWMIDVPDRLPFDWYVFARPAGKWCFVVSSNGITVSRLRNGSVLHRFPSALPNGSRTRDASGTAQSYSILDCIFHESDQTYYVIDMVCWRGYPLYDCTAEFRFFWMNSKLAETGACNLPSQHHKYKFSLVPVYNCDEDGLKAAYMGAVPYVKDGLLFYNKKKTPSLNSHNQRSSLRSDQYRMPRGQAHYQTGNTPLALVWKDERCSQYVIDTDSKGNVPSQQQVVLELQDDGKLTTSDDPPAVFGSLDSEFIQKSRLQPGNLLRFALGDGGLNIVDGRLESAEIHYIGQSNRARAFADSYSKVMFQYTVRHSPLRIDDLLSSIVSTRGQEPAPSDVEMAG